MLKLNVGAGNTKIEGFLGIDIWKGDGVDHIINICTEKLPFEDGSAEMIVMSHVIEHLEEKYQPYILDEFWRVLCPGGKIMFAYPEFKIIAQHYIDDTRGMRDYWKMTIYGRQAHAGDFHITLMDTDYFVQTLEDHGFDVIKREIQFGSDFNTLLVAQKATKPDKREDVLAQEIFGVDKS